MKKQWKSLNKMLALAVLLAAQFGFASLSFGQASDSVYSTGQYRSLFNEYDNNSDASNPGNPPFVSILQWLIDYKILVGYEEYFFTGTNTGDQANQQRLMYDAGNNEAYILDVYDNDIRSEGMSYGMMIAVQMGDQTTFDKLWRFAKNHMRQPQGHFAWHVSPTNFSPIDTGAAPDGEEYMAMALFFAQNRWGSGTMNYGQEANAILDVLRTRFFDQNNHLIKFIENANYTDPSYMLPAFYELWGQWASGNNQFWQQAASAARTYLKNAASSNGLYTDYMNFDGTPVAANTNNNAESNHFAYDSWRVIQNLAVDYYWWSRDSGLKTIVENQQQFFKNQGITSYVNRYDYNGNPIGSDHSEGHVFMNAVGSLVGTGSLSQDYIRDLFHWMPPEGTFRYYDGLLYMFGMMHISGDFQIIKPGFTAKSGDFSYDENTQAQPSFLIMNATDAPLSNFKANYYFTVENGKTPVLIDDSTPNAAASLRQVNGSLWAVQLDYAGHTLAPGASIPADGNNPDTLTIRYSDGSYFDKSNDFSQPQGQAAGLATFTDRIAIYDNTGHLVMGKEPAQTPYAAHIVSSWSQYRLTAAGTQNNAETRVQEVNNGWATQNWQIEPVPGTAYVRVKNPWTGRYLNCQNNTENASVVMYDLQSSWGSEEWVLEAVPGSSAVRLRNVWSGRYLTAVDSSNYSAVLSKTLHTDWASQIWVIQQ